MLIIILIIYILSVIINGLEIYKEMKKGESLEEWMYRTESKDILTIVFVPVLNTFLALLVLCYIICDKIKKFRK